MVKPPKGVWWISTHSLVCRWSRVLRLVILGEQTCILIGQNGSVGDSIIAQQTQTRCFRIPAVKSHMSCDLIGALKFLSLAQGMCPYSPDPFSLPARGWGLGTGLECQRKPGPQLASSPGHFELFNVHEKNGRAWYATARDHPNHEVKRI